MRVLVGSAANVCWAVAATAMVLALSGCTASYRNVRTGGTAQTFKHSLDRKGTVYVALPKDGAYGAKPYVGSGRTVASAVAQAFSPKAGSVEVAESVQTREDVVAEAKRIGARYAIITTIVQWEQRATEWSGRPSRMAIDLSIYDTDTGARIDSRSIKARSRVVSFTSTSPESLLTAPLRQYAQELYGVSHGE